VHVLIVLASDAVILKNLLLAGVGGHWARFGTAPNYCR